MFDLYKDADGSPIFSEDIEAQQKELTEDQIRQHEQWKKDFHETFCTSEYGRRVLWYLMHECGIWKTYMKKDAGVYGWAVTHALGMQILEFIGSEETLAAMIQVRNENLRKEVNKDG